MAFTMRCLEKIRTILAVSLLAPTLVHGQDLRLLIPGHNGPPLLVRDEGEHDNWSGVISVYSDDDLEMFVSKRLTLGGLNWDEAQFEKQGTYATYLYSFYKNANLCREQRMPEGHSSDPKYLEACAELRYQRRLLEVDTHKNTVTIQEIVLMHADGQYHPELQQFPKKTVPLNDTANRPLFQAVSRITAMIEQGIEKRSIP